MHGAPLMRSAAIVRVRTQPARGENARVMLRQRGKMRAAMVWRKRKDAAALMRNPSAAARLSMIAATMDTTGAQIIDGDELPRQSDCSRCPAAKPRREQRMPLINDATRYSRPNASITLLHLFLHFHPRPRAARARAFILARQSPRHRRRHYRFQFATSSRRRCPPVARRRWSYHCFQTAPHNYACAAFHYLFGTTPVTACRRFRRLL